VTSTPENPSPSRRRSGVRRDPAGRVRQHSGDGDAVESGIGGLMRISMTDSWSR
jgi:hypothetical protein